MSAKWLRLYIDGASRGNPGLSGAGIVILDERNQVLAQLAHFLGEATNNVAEYQALIYGLKHAKLLTATHLTILSDSLLLVNQLNGLYQVRSPHLLSLFKQAQDLIKTFQKVEFIHIPREFNKEADRLANQAIDRRNS